MSYVIPDTLLKVSLNTNKTGHHVLHYTRHIVESGVKHQQNFTMSYIIPDALLKVSLNTNVLRFTWHIVESVVKHQ